MWMAFGRHSGRSVEAVVLKQPDYVVWMWEQRQPGSRLSAARAKARRLIQAFDAKPFVVPCSEHDCRRRATQFSVYDGSTRIVFWCRRCRPSRFGGKVSLANTYVELVNHVLSTASGGREALRSAVRALAEAKGLPRRVGESQAQEFFAEANRGVEFPLAGAD